MFEQMIADLRSGIFPENELLRKRFEVALVKKIGVINTPYHFWSSDPKINPSAKELLWAAILLEDRDNFMLNEGIIATELDEKRKASGQKTDGAIAAQDNDQIIESYIQEFLDLSPSAGFRKLLEKMILNTKNR